MAVDRWSWAHANPSTVHLAEEEQLHNTASRYRFTDYINDGGNLSWPKILFQATQEQVQTAYYALSHQGNPADFNQRVWNDIVDKIVELQVDWDVSIRNRLDNQHGFEVQNPDSAYISSADPGYTRAHYSETNFQHRNLGKTLRASKFNKCVDAFVTLPSTWRWQWDIEGKTIYTGQIAYGQYILELTRAINRWCAQEKLDIEGILTLHPYFSMSIITGIIRSIPIFNLRCNFSEDHDITITPEIIRYWDIITNPEFTKTFEFSNIGLELARYAAFTIRLLVNSHIDCLGAELIDTLPISVNLADSLIMRILDCSTIRSLPTSANLRFDSDMYSNVGLFSSTPFAALLNVLTDVVISETIIDQYIEIPQASLLVPTRFDVYPRISSSIEIKDIDISSDFVYNNIVVNQIECWPAKSLSSVSTGLTAGIVAKLSPGNFIEFTVHTEMSHDNSASIEQIETVGFEADSTVTSDGGGSVNFVPTLEFEASAETGVVESVSMRASATFEFSAIVTGVEVVSVTELRKIQYLDMPNTEAEIATDHSATIEKTQYLEIAAAASLADGETVELARTVAGSLSAQELFTIRVIASGTALHAASSMSAFTSFTVSTYVGLIARHSAAAAAADTGVVVEANVTPNYQRLVQFEGIHSVGAETFTHLEFQVPKALAISATLENFVVTTNLQFAQGLALTASGTMSHTAELLPPDTQHPQDMGNIYDLEAFTVGAHLEVERSSAWHPPVWETIDGVRGLNIYQIHTVMRQRDYPDRIRIDAMWEQELGVAAGVMIEANTPLIVRYASPLEVLTSLEMSGTSIIDQSGWRYPYRLAGTKVITFYQAHSVVQDGDTIDIETENT